MLEVQGMLATHVLGLEVLDLLGRCLVPCVLPQRIHVCCHSGSMGALTSRGCKLLEVGMLSGCIGGGRVIVQGPLNAMAADSWGIHPQLRSRTGTVPFHSI